MRGSASGTILPLFAERSKVASQLETVNRAAAMPANYDEAVLQRIFELADAGQLSGQPRDFTALNLSINSLVESLQRLDRLGIFHNLHTRKSYRDESGWYTFAIEIDPEALEEVRQRDEGE